jgi:hypothetical protein
VIIGVTNMMLSAQRVTGRRNGYRHAHIEARS